MGMLNECGECVSIARFVSVISVCGMEPKWQQALSFVREIQLRRACTGAVAASAVLCERCESSMPLSMISFSAEALKSIAATKHYSAGASLIFETPLDAEIAQLHLGRLVFCIDC